jgi:hypothetical protein
MIDFNNLNVRRIIIHTINPKQNGQDSATAEYSPEILEIEENVLAIIKVRLIDAAGRNSKAFELQIENTNSNSFYDLSSDLNNLNNRDFITTTSVIADLLAESQRKTSIPGGYLMIMNCSDSETDLPVHIVIKAEPHEALQFSKIDGHSQVSVLHKVFLSPSQKLYKIGIIYAKTDEALEDINEQFGCFLYDDQFRTDTHPAEYFYKDFLGFSVGKNAKIQSQRFYDKTERFIMTNITNIEKKANLLSVLKTEFSTNADPTVNPINFANTYIPAENGIRDRYIGDVCQELPFAIIKDTILIKTRLSKRKIDFPSNINVVGPEESFDERVIIIDNPETLNELDVNNQQYTILKIVGKPYSSNE